jgi:predicted transcriptional regulator
MASPETRELVVRLPADLHARLKERAEEEDRSTAATIRVALRRYLEKAE